MPTTGEPLGSPFALGNPTPATAPSSGYPFSRYVDGIHGTYAVDADTGLYSKMPPVRQRVAIITRTVLGSSTTLPLLGVSKPRKITPGLTRQLNNEIRSAFYQMIYVEKSLRLDSLRVETSGLGRVNVLIEYFDRTTGEPGSFSESV